MELKKAMCLLLAAVFIMTSLLSGCRKNSEKDDDDDDNDKSRYLRAEINYDDIKYSRPDFDSLLAKTDSIEEMADNGEDEDDVYDAFEELDDELVEAFTMKSVLEFTQSVDTTDEKIANELNDIAEPLALCSQAYFRLAAKLLDSDYEEALFGDYTEEEKQEIRDEAEARDDEYVELTKRQTELVTKYKSNLTLETEIEGEVMTLEEVMEEYGEMTYYEELNKVCGQIYIDLISVNKQLAAKRGYDSFAAYAYKEEYGRDFTPSDSDALSEYIKKYILPLYFEIASKTEDYEDEEEFDLFEYDEILAEYFGSIDPRMLEAYNYMKEFGLYVIDDDDVMQAGAYTTYLDSFDVPLIFIHTTGTYYDLETFIHEFGHFYSFYLYGSELDYNIDIDEIHSQGDEVLFLPVYKKIFNKSAYEKISASNLLTYFNNMITAVLIDRFEQLAYTSELFTVEDVNSLFEKAYNDFGLVCPYDYTWTMINHLFEVPMYYISYGTSLIPTLEIYVASLSDYDKAVEMYNAIMTYSIDATGFCDLAEHTSMPDPFDEGTLKDIAKKIKKNLFD